MGGVATVLHCHACSLSLEDVSYCGPLLLVSRFQCPE